ncbi:hypothetical protein HUG10_20720 (plasmid) [Halorarum halophilum]|uniref:Uncharacterized protein n=1 Tax=Halorarum halophilum TaxID=2743090 RepID=A0A7D5GEU6_9EURY|nr:hypothetical protein [Halobaculum halophilum]QLG30032.1 hypothetical protein HUG10_20720 [Halobaculum halophilum]
MSPTTAAGGIQSSGEGWDSVDDDCMLCEMEQCTHWYYEDDELVIADNLVGRPFVIWKDHKQSVSIDELQTVQHRVRGIFSDHELQVIMNMVPDHWHAHIVEPGGDRAYLRFE